MSERTKTQSRIASDRARRPFRVASNGLSKRERENYRNADDLCASIFAVMDENLAVAVAVGTRKSELRYVYLREIYRAVTALLQGQTQSQLEEMFRMALNSRSPYSDKRSLFSLAIQAYEKDRPETTSKATRSIRASALAYAWRHNKAPEDVPQFLINIGGIKKAADFARDPDMLHHWARSR